MTTEESLRQTEAPHAMALKITTICLNGGLAAVYGTIAAILFLGLWRHRGRAFNLLGLMLALVTLTAGLSYLAHALIIGLSPWRPEKVTYTALSAVSLVPTAILLALYRRFGAFLGGARLLDETRLQLRERNAQLESLVELSAQLSRFHQLQAVLQSALRQCVAHSGARIGLFLLRHQETGDLALSGHDGVDDGRAAELAESAPVRALAEAVAQQARLLTEEPTPSERRSVAFDRLHIRQMIALPVQSPHGVIGVVCLLSRRPLSPSAEQLSLLEAVGQQIGIAVESARWSEAQDQLGQELQRRVESATEELRTSYQTVESSRRRLQAVVDSMPSGLVMLDAGDAVAMVNQQAEELLAVARDDLLGKPLRECGVSEEMAAALGPNGQTGVGRRDVLLSLPSPRTVRVDTAAIPGTDGRRLGRVCVLTDVTREREIDQMKTEFVSLVSHELRTPLTSIIGFVSLLLEGEIGNLNATQRRSLGSVHRQARRLAALISDLLDVSRIESRQDTMRQDPVDLNAVLRGVLQELHGPAEEKRLSVALSDDGAAAFLRGDRERLTQVFTNLLSNAIKFTPEGGGIQVDLRRSGESLVATVSDTGPGIAPAELHRIFDKFYQVEAVASRKTGGSGLGLSIVRGIVEAHGGRVEAANRPEGGASFSVHLPARKVPARVVSQPVGTAPLILIADEDAAATTLLTTGLQQVGYRALAVNDLRQVALQANAVRPDLIAFSLQSPTDRATEMLESLQRDAATRDIPVLAMGAGDSEALLRGAADSLTAGEGAAWRERLAGLLTSAGYTVRGVAAGAAGLAAELRARLPGRRPVQDAEGDLGEAADSAD